MSVSAPAPARPRFTRGGKIRAILALGTVLGVGTVLTLAAWTDSGEVAGTFSTGTIDLKLDGVDTLPVVTSLALTNAKPGDVTYAPLTVSNEGTLDFGYVMTPSIQTASTSTPLLESVLLLTVKKVANTGECAAGAAFTAAPTVIAEVALDAAGATTTSPLATGASEVLCFKVELPSGASTGVQGQTTTALFSFLATQS